jgi:hypothetical protein
MLRPVNREIRSPRRPGPRASSRIQRNDDALAEPLYLDQHDDAGDRIAAPVVLMAN